MGLEGSLWRLRFTFPYNLGYFSNRTCKTWSCGEKNQGNLKRCYTNIPNSSDFFQDVDLVVTGAGRPEPATKLTLLHLTSSSFAKSEQANKTPRLVDGYQPTALEGLM